MAKTAAVVLADGFETIEALASVDVLRRGGIQVYEVSVKSDLNVESGQQVIVESNGSITQMDLTDVDMLIIPGGATGVENLRQCEELKRVATYFMQNGKYLSAICAAPMLLAEWDLLEDKVATCYPGCQTDFPEGHYVDSIGVVYDNNLITASGPGQALEFALANLKQLAGEDVAQDVAKAMLTHV